MFVFDESSTRRVLTPWGTEVKKRLLDKGMQQNDLVRALKKEGFAIERGHLSNLLYGIGIGSRTKEITTINRILDIPCGNSRGVQQVARTITIPVESIVTFNSTGNIRVEHTKTVTVEVGESYVLAMLGIKGTSPEKVIQDVMGK